MQDKIKNTWKEKCKDNKSMDEQKYLCFHAQVTNSGFPSPGSQVAHVTEFRTVAHNSYLFSVRSRAPRIVKRILDFFLKMAASLS